MRHIIFSASPTAITSAASDLLRAGANVMQPLPTKVEGASYTTWAVAFLTILVAPISLAVIRNRGSWMKQRDTAADKLLSRAMHRIDRLERQWLADRRECDRQLRASQRKADGVQRAFLQHQLALVRFLPAAGPALNASINELTALIAQPVEDFLEPPGEHENDDKVSDDDEPEDDE